MNDNNSSAGFTLDHINSQIELFFSDMEHINHKNIRRILIYYTSIVRASSRGLKTIFGYKDEIDPLLRIEASKTVIEHNTRLLLKLFEIFEEFNVEITPFLSEEDFSTNEDEFPDLLFKLQKETEPVFNLLTHLYGFSQEEKTENFGLISDIIHENKKLTNEHFDVIKVIVDSYKEYYELFVNEVLRPVYLQIEYKDKEETLPRQDSGGKIVNFFKKWQDAKFSELMNGYDPFVRNAIIHTQRKRWEFKISKQIYIFRDSNLENPREVPLRKFLLDYLSNVEVVWNLADTQVSIVKSIMSSEEAFIEYIKGERDSLPTFPLKYFHPLVQIFTAVASLLRKNREQIKTLNKIDVISNELIIEILKLVTFERESLLIPVIFRYCVSNYPFRKPDEYKLALCKEYTRIVPRESVGENRKNIVDLKTKIELDLQRV